MTQSGIRFVTQHLNHCRQPVVSSQNYGTSYILPASILHASLKRLNMTLHVQVAKQVMTPRRSWCVWRGAGAADKWVQRAAISGSDSSFCRYTQTEHNKHFEQRVMSECTARMISGCVSSSRHSPPNLAHAHLSRSQQESPPLLSQNTVSFFLRGFRGGLNSSQLFCYRINHTGDEHRADINGMKTYRTRLTHILPSDCFQIISLNVSFLQILAA